jgi:hypothetical protein
MEIALSRVFRISFVLMLFITATVAGCATSGGSGPDGEKFGNLLVIGIAGSWDSRAQFERGVVSGLRADGIDAKPYSVVVGGGKLATRDDVLTAIGEHGFDAVVVTRVLDVKADAELRDAVTGTKVTRKDSGFMKLFRYDYEEIGDPPDLTVNTQVEFVTELYSSGSEELVWSSQTKAPKSDNVPMMVDESAKLVVRQLRRSGKLAR